MRIVRTESKREIGSRNQVVVSLLVIIPDLCTGDLVRALSRDGTRIRQWRRYRSSRQTLKSSVDNEFHRRPVRTFFGLTQQIILSRQSPFVTGLFRHGLSRQKHIQKYLVPGVYYIIPKCQTSANLRRAQYRSIRVAQPLPNKIAVRISFFNAVR